MPDVAAPPPTWSPAPDPLGMSYQRTSAPPLFGASSFNIDTILGGLQRVGDTVLPFVMEANRREAEIRRIRAQENVGLASLGTTLGNVRSLYGRSGGLPALPGAGLGARFNLPTWAPLAAAGALLVVLVKR